MEQTIEMMRKRHAYFSSLIKEHDIKTAKQFYEEFYDRFLLFGIELLLDSDAKQCGICIELEYSDYEQYTVTEGDGILAKVSPFVWWNDNYCANSEVNIFEEEKL